jgi:hypothetical protein
MVPDDWHNLLVQLNSIPDNDTSSPAAMSLAKHWLRTCVEGHDRCNRNRTSQYSPTRIIDVGGLKFGHRPRILHNVVLHEHYIALSHRWGVKGLPITTRSNLTYRKEGFDLTELSQTMRDAIDIVLALGYRYVWIDALCIIQDSPDDWLCEASKMSSVFSGAVVTIAVADAEDHTQGIFRKRVARCNRPFYIPYLKGIPYRDKTHSDGEGKYYIFPRNDIVGAGARSKGTLDTRGWM